MSIKGDAQTDSIPLITYLKESKFSGLLVSKDPNNQLINIPNTANCFYPVHNYLWLQNKLVMKLDGAGKLFEINPNKKFKRLDSTCYDGYNFGAFNFVYNDTIFSLGGYGFWQFNGMLRYFDQKTSEWSVLPSNKSIPIKVKLSSNFFYDTEDEKIYLMYLIPKKIEMDDEVDDRTVYVQCLDLKTKKWWKEAKKLNTEIIKDYDWLPPGYFHTKQGLIVEWRNELFLLDFKNNDISSLEPTTNLSILNQLNISKKLINFTHNNQLNFYDIKSGKIDSIAFTEKNIIKSNNALFIEDKRENAYISNFNYWQFILIGLLLTALSVIIFLIKKIGIQNLYGPNNFALNSKLEEISEIIIHNKTSFKENLTEIEKSLLELLISNTSDGKMTTANQINQVLGIAKKPSKIQNNIRASNIQMVNQKFMVYSGINDNLIIKERTEFDKRFFEFAIDNKYLVKVK